MNKLLVIAVLFGLTSAQEIFEPVVSHSLDIDPHSIHHSDEEGDI